MSQQKANDKQVKARLGRITDRLTRRAIKCLYLNSWIEMQKALKPLGIEGEWTSYTRFVMDGGKTPPQKIHEITLTSRFVTKYTNDGTFISSRLYEKAEGKTPQEALIKLRTKMEI